MAEAMILGIVAATFLTIVFGTILTIYFVKIARRLGSLIEILEREAVCRFEKNYGLPGPSPLQEGEFPE